jgi:hypothetical protein
MGEPRKPISTPLYVIGIVLIGITTVCLCGVLGLVVDEYV